MAVSEEIDEVRPAGPDASALLTRLRRLLDRTPPGAEAMTLAQSLRGTAPNRQLLSLLLAKADELKAWPLYFPMMMGVASRAHAWEQVVVAGKGWLRAGPSDDRSIVEIFRNGAMALRALHRIRTIERLAVHLEGRFERGRLPVLLYINILRALHMRWPLEKIDDLVRGHADAEVQQAYVESLVELAKLERALALATELNVPVARLSASNRAILIHFLLRRQGFKRQAKRAYLDEIVDDLVHRYLLQAPHKATSRKGLGGPIRILIHASSLGLGGSERQLIHLLEAFDSKPKLYDVLLVSRHRRRDQFPLDSLQNVKIVYRDELEEPVSDALLKVAPDIVLKDIELLLRRPKFKSFLQLAATFRPHVVYNAVGLDTTDAILVGLLTQARDIVVRFGGLGFDPADDGSDEGRFVHLVSERTAALAASRVTFVANSHAAQASWVEKLAVPREAVNVIWNGTAFGDLLPPAARKAKKIELFGRAEAIVIGWVGRFHDVKRPALWGRIALKLAERHPGMRFLMVGDGPLRAPLQHALAASPYNESFVFAGSVLDGLNDLYQAMDVLLVTSSSESFSNAVAEALGHGVYVISSDVGETSAIIHDPMLGRIVPAGDEDAFVSALRDAVRNIGDISAERGKRAVDTRKRLSVAKMWGAYVQLFRKHRNEPLDRPAVFSAEIP